MNKQLLAAAAALALAAPVAVQAQEVPSYAAQADQQIRGRITSFDGSYNLQVRDDNGYVDNVELHDGTIINPTGLTLAPGMVVSILGYNAGNAFDANEIDTPYQVEDAVAFYGGHPWSYYGPSVDLSFFFGDTGWWHGPGVRGYGRGTAYIGTRVNRVIVNNYTTNERTRVTPPGPERPYAPNGRPGSPGTRPGAPVGRPSAPVGRPNAPVGRPAAPVGRPEGPGARPAAPVDRPAAPRAENGSGANRGAQRSGNSGSARGSGNRDRR